MGICLPRWTTVKIVTGCCAGAYLAVLAGFCAAEPPEEELTAAEARVCVTGFDHNRPDPFPGLGDFIGWAEAIERMPNGDLLLAHSAGYYHASFASPRQLEPKLKKQYASEGWPVDYVAPTGGRSMVCRSTDNGKTWSKPELVVDYRLDDRPDALFTCRDGTVLCCVNVQASWYGYPQAPPGYEDDIRGLNTQQFVVRSTDNGHTWSDPIWIEPPPGATYERAHGRPIQLDDGGILWATYCNSPEEIFGAVHRSDDSGKTWKIHAVIRRENNKHVDEPAIAQLNDGRLIMVARPDGGVLYSDDDGANWVESGSTVITSGKMKAPQLFVLQDGTVVMVGTWRNLRVWLSPDNGQTWTNDLPLDTTCYGYPGGLVLDDESILVSYCKSGRTPNRVYVIRFQVNEARTDIQLLPVGDP